MPNQPNQSPFCPIGHRCHRTPPHSRLRTSQPCQYRIRVDNGGQCDVAPICTPHGVRRPHQLTPAVTSPHQPSPSRSCPRRAPDLCIAAAHRASPCFEDDCLPNESQLTCIWQSITLRRRNCVPTREFPIVTGLTTPWGTFLGNVLLRRAGRGWILPKVPK